MELKLEVLRLQTGLSWSFRRPQALLHSLGTFAQASSPTADGGPLHPPNALSAPAHPFHTWCWHPLQTPALPVTVWMSPQNSEVKT